MMVVRARFGDLTLRDGQVEIERVRERESLKIRKSEVRGMQEKGRRREKRRRVALSIWIL